MNENEANEDVRNPSPPPDINGAPGDNIGTTAFSQHWLFQQLMDLLKYVDDSAMSETDCPSELDVKVEDSMCVLWDMSVELEVANFLMEFKAKDIFMGVLVKTQAPRLQEIILGILGNMATHKDICDHFAYDNDFMICILQTLMSDDTPSLIQTLRFLNSCVVSESTGTKWIQLIIEFETCQDVLKFVLSSSLKVDLLKSTLKLLYECLDKEDDFIVKLTSDGYLKAIIDSGRQIVIVRDFEALDEFWHFVQLLTTFSNACKILETFSAELTNYAKEYLTELSMEDSLTPPESRLPAITAAFATINAILEVSLPENLKHFESLKDSPLMDYFNKLKQHLTETDQETESSIITETVNQIDKLLASLNKAPT